MSELDAVLRDALRVRLLRRMGHAVQHDLKSPLQGVSWSLDLAQRAIAREGDPGRDQVLKAVSMARKELARLERNMRCLLGDAGILADEEQSFDLGETARELARHFVTEAAMRELQLVVSVPEEPVMVRGPRSEVAQVILVYLVNIFDTLPSGGQAEISVRREGDRALVEIKDNALPGASSGEYSLAAMGGRIAEATLGLFGGEIRVEERARPWRRATTVRLLLAEAPAAVPLRALVEERI